MDDESGLSKGSGHFDPSLLIVNMLVELPPPQNSFWMRYDTIAYAQNVRSEIDCYPV